MGVQAESAYLDFMEQELMFADHSSCYSYRAISHSCTRTRGGDCIGCASNATYATAGMFGDCAERNVVSRAAATDLSSICT